MNKYYSRKTVNKTQKDIACLYLNSEYITDESCQKSIKSFIADMTMGELNNTGTSKNYSVHFRLSDENIEYDTELIVSRIIREEYFAIFPDQENKE